MCHLLSWKITSRMKIDDHEDEVEKEHYQLVDGGYAPGASGMSFGLIFHHFLRATMYNNLPLDPEPSPISSDVVEHIQRICTWASTAPKSREKKHRRRVPHPVREFAFAKEGASGITVARGDEKQINYVRRSSTLFSIRARSAAHP